MTDREKLIQLISEIVVPYFAEQIADHLLANGVTVQKWIPVTERLPIQGETVLAWAAPFVSKAWRNEKGDWVTTNGPAASLKPVTHWMPRPKPPEDGNCQ